MQVVLMGKPDDAVVRCIARTQAFGKSPAREDISLASVVHNSGIILIGEDAPEGPATTERRPQLLLSSGRRIRVPAIVLRDGNVLCSAL